MCHRSQHTDTHTSTQKHTTTAHTIHHNGWHMYMKVMFPCTMYVQYLHVMSHRRTHIYKHTESTSYSTHTILWCVFLDAWLCVCRCAVTSIIGTCACNDSRSLGVDVSRHVSQSKLNPTIFNCYTHCRLSYHMALLHLHWVLSHNNINRATMQSLLAAAIDNYLYCYQEQLQYCMELPRWRWDEWIV